MRLEANPVLRLFRKQRTPPCHFDGGALPVVAAHGRSENLAVGIAIQPASGIAQEGICRKLAKFEFVHKTWKNARPQSTTHCWLHPAFCVKEGRF